MHPNAEISIQDPKGMTGIYPCPECRRNTTHSVLSIVNSNWSDEYAQFWGHFLTVHCNGCGTLSFCHVSKCSEEEEYDERGHPFLPQHKIHYPSIVDTSATIAEHFVEESRIQELVKIGPSKLDTAKLSQMLTELNRSYADHSFFSCVFLIRAILDHVPPIFGLKRFSEIANNYAGGGGRSFRQHMQHLENSSRKLADSHLHQHIRSKETLPTTSQIEFRADIDSLLAEIIRILAQKP